MFGGTDADDAAPARAEFGLIEQAGKLVDGDDRVGSARSPPPLVYKPDLAGSGVYLQPRVPLALVTVLVGNEHVHLPELQHVGGEDGGRYHQQEQRDEREVSTGHLASPLTEGSPLSAILRF